MEKSKVALVHRDSLAGAMGSDEDVLDYPPESVAAIREMIEEGRR